MQSNTQALGPRAPTSDSCVSGRGTTRGSDSPPGVLESSHWALGRPAHRREQGPLTAPSQFILNFTYDNRKGRLDARPRLLGDDGSLAGLPELKGLLGPGVPPFRPGSCRLFTFPPRSRLAYSSAPDPRHAVPAAPHRTGQPPLPPKNVLLDRTLASAPRACGLPPSISGITPSVSCFAVLRLTGGQAQSSQSRALEMYFLLCVKTITFHLTQWKRNLLNAALRRTGQRPHVQLNSPAGNVATQTKNLKCSGPLTRKLGIKLRRQWDMCARRVQGPTSHSVGPSREGEKR